MAASFGVHVGATSMCIAVARDGKVDVVANDSGDRVTPACVAFTDHDLSIGLAAKQGLIRNASNTVCNNKLLLGKKLDDQEVEMVSNMGHAKIIEKDDSIAVEVQYKEKKSTFSPVQISKMLNQKMREIADSHGGAGESHDMVLTVPLEYTEEQQNLARQAATEAGFTVMRVVSEPAAAILAYDIGQASIHDYSRVLVYRLGGMSAEATVVDVNAGMFRVLATESSLQYRGHDITDLLVNHFASEFKRQWKQDCLDNKRSKAKLRNAAENCKHVLSTMSSCQTSVDSLFDGIDFQCTLSRARFEGLCGPYMLRALEPINRVLQKAKSTHNDVNKVIVCGGSGRIPYLQQQLQELFPQAEVLSSIPPDEVIATGAAKEAAILCGREQAELEKYEKLTEVPCLSADIVIQTQKGEDLSEQVIYHQFTPVPIKCSNKYQLLPNETSLLLNIGWRTGKQDFASFGKICMRELPAGSDVSVLYHIKSDGCLHAVCTSSSTGKVAEITVGISGLG